MKILMVGGNGKLGQHLKIQADRPTHKELDITKEVQPGKYDLVIHCAAWTNVEDAEKYRLDCFDVNVRGTLNLLNAYRDIPFVFISSEYAHKPVNFYSITKSLAEQLVMYHEQYLIIRTLFKPRPFPHKYAFKDQYTMGGYVDDVAHEIDNIIRNWDFKSKLVYTDLGRKTMLELARQTVPGVIPNSVDDIKGVKIPRDYI